MRKASEKRLSKESKLKLDQTNNEELIQEFDRIASLSSEEEPFDQLNTLKGTAETFPAQYYLQVNASKISLNKV